MMCACYRSPTKCKEADYVFAENMYSSRKELLLLGDFNMDTYENRDESCFPADTRLVDFCNQFYVSNRIIYQPMQFYY